MIRAREYLDANSMMQQCFEQDVLMHQKGLQIHASDLWGPGHLAFLNNLLINSYDRSYEVQLILGPPENFDSDSKLYTKQIAQITKLLRVLPAKDISIKLDLGNTNNRVFIRLLKSAFRKLGLLSKFTFKPVECQGTTWVEVLSSFRKTQPIKVSLQMMRTMFYSNKEKIRHGLLHALKNAGEFSFQAFPLTATNRIGWFADTQRTMDVFKNLRRISLDPFILEDCYYYNYERLFKTMTKLEEVTLVCHNRDSFRLSDTYLTFPETLKRLSLTFASLWDKDSIRNIFNSIFTKQQALMDLEELQIVIKYQPPSAVTQAPPILHEYSFLEHLICPNLKILKLHLDLVRKISLTGLERLSKLETFELTLGYNVEKIRFADNHPFPENLKKFAFQYDPEKQLSDYKTEIHHTFITFLTKQLKNPEAKFVNGLSELHFGEVIVNSELMQSICLPSLESLSFNQCFFLERDFIKLLNNERLTNLRSLCVRESLMRDKSIVNEKLFQIIAESSIAKRIEELGLESMEFSDGNLETIQLAGRCFPNLRRLNLRHSIKLKFKGLAKILQIEMPRLEYLNIENIRCPYLSLQVLLLERVPHLKELKLDAGHFHINDSGTTMAFKTKFLKVTNFGVFKSKM